MRFTGSCLELKEIILSEIIQIQKIIFVLHKIIMMTLTLVYFIFSCIISTWLASFSGSFLQWIRVKNTLSNGISSKYQKGFNFSLNILWFMTIRKLYFIIYAVHILDHDIWMGNLLYTLKFKFIFYFSWNQLYTRNIKEEMQL